MPYFATEPIPQNSTEQGNIKTMELELGQPTRHLQAVLVTIESDICSLTFAASWSQGQIPVHANAALMISGFSTFWRIWCNFLIISIFDIFLPRVSKLYSSRQRSHCFYREVKGRSSKGYMKCVE